MAERLGISEADAVEAISRQVEVEADRRLFLGAVIMAGRPGELLYHKAYGQRDAGQPMDTDSIFDVASITKVAATATALAMTLDRHPQVSVDDLMRDHLPGMTGKGSNKITIRHTAMHRSGLDNAKHLHETREGEALVQAILERDISKPLNQERVYSCLGIIRMSEMIAAINGTEFGVFCRENIFQPLGMNETWFGPVPESVSERCVMFRLGRKGIPCNTEARKIGRPVGNAGLFTTATDLSRIAELWLNKGRYGDRQFFSPSIAEMMSQQHIVWRTGNDPEIPTVPANSSSCVFSHTGYTGQSLIIDPAANGYLIMLTNRDHPAVSAEPDASVEGRRRIAAVVFEELFGRSI